VFLLSGLCCLSAEEKRAAMKNYFERKSTQRGRIRVFVTIILTKHDEAG
jgi:hypothetical protein